jgi:hypothetical protein
MAGVAHSPLLWRASNNRRTTADSPARAEEHSPDLLDVDSDGIKSRQRPLPLLRWLARFWRLAEAALQPLEALVDRLPVAFAELPPDGGP